MRAYLKNYRQAPRKVRLIADAVRGKNVATALADLSVMSQKAASVLHKLIVSAVANAQQKDSGMKADQLIVRTVMVDKGITYVRFMPRAFGRATPIKRECSHILVILEKQPEGKAKNEKRKSKASEEHVAPSEQKEALAKHKK